MILDSKKNGINKKVILQILFLIFIFLNIIDFLNIIAGDLDFFKKLISWTVIAYIFYLASFTKIVIGKRLKNYDLLFIIAFSLMSLTKALLLYSRTNIITEKTYPLFYFILTLILEVNSTVAIQVTFLLGLLIIVVGSVAILSNYKIESKSFLGSLNIKEGYFRYILLLFSLITISIFFGLLIFNFFMEWFALAVDSIILILGLIYYVFIYLNHHTTTKLDSILRSISNTGNEFYSKVIITFSDKKTLFIGMSFLLTLHALVDTGVYLVPYSIGTENSLYFSSLTTVEREHIPIFNFFTFENSRFYEDLVSTNFLSVKIAIFLIHLDILFLFFILMAFPFFAYYKNMQKAHLNLPKIFVVLFMSSLLTWFFLLLSAGVNPPINLGFPQTESIAGVDIFTSSLSENQNQIIFASSILKIFLFFIISTSILGYVKNKWYIPFKKVMYVTTLIFFTIYLSMYYISTVEIEAKQFEKDLNLQKTDNSINPTYLEYFKILGNKNTYKSIDNLSFQENGIAISTRYFWTLKNNANDHIDYISFVARGFDDLKKVKFNKNYNIILEKKGLYNVQSGGVVGKEIKGVVLIGTNKFNLKEEGKLMQRGEYRSQIATSIFEISQNKQLNSFTKTEKVIGYLRLIFLSVFYIFGIISFIIFYLRNNVFNTNEILP